MEREVGVGGVNSKFRPVWLKSIAGNLCWLLDSYYRQGLGHNRSISMCVKEQTKLKILAVNKTECLRIKQKSKKESMLD